MKLQKVVRVVSGLVGELPIQDGGGSFKPQKLERHRTVQALLKAQQQRSLK